MMSIKKSLLLLTLLFLTFAGCKDDNSDSYQTGNVTLEFDNVVGSVHIDVFGNTNYTNGSGESFNVTALKYYLSNFELKKSDGTWYSVPESYFLLDEVSVSTHKMTLKNIPGGEYIGMKYLIGVDSARNVSGSQTGALDPANGMFWTWSQGYIFLKLEGRSPAAITVANPSGNYHYNIMGFTQAEGNALRTVEAGFGNSTLIVDGNREADLHTIVDLQMLFTDPVNISLASLNAVDSAGPDAVMIAENYKDMFRFDHLHNGN